MNVAPTWMAYFKQCLYLIQYIGAKSFQKYRNFQKICQIISVRKHHTDLVFFSRLCIAFCTYSFFPLNAENDLKNICTQQRGPKNDGTFKKLLQPKLDLTAWREIYGQKTFLMEFQTCILMLYVYLQTHRMGILFLRSIPHFM